MTSLCTPKKTSRIGNGTKMFGKGAPEGVLEHYIFIRIESEKMPTTKIMDRAIGHGTGHGPLCCLALGACNSSSYPKIWDLDTATKFVTYEVNIAFVGTHR